MLQAPWTFPACFAVDGYGESRIRTCHHTCASRKVLFLSQDPAGTEQHLLSAIQSAHFEVTQTSNIPVARLADYQLVVFNNWDLEALPTATKNAAEQYVKQGGGLLVIGGERNVYVEGKKVEDAMDRALPAKLAPPKIPRRHLRRSHHRQVLVHGRPQDGTRPPRRPSA